MSEKLFSIDEAAEYLGVSTWFIRNRFKDGSLVPVRLGSNRITRIRESDIDAFVESRRVSKISAK